MSRRVNLGTPRGPLEPAPFLTPAQRVAAWIVGGFALVLGVALLAAVLALLWIAVVALYRWAL